MVEGEPRKAKDPASHNESLRFSPTDSQAAERLVASKTLSGRDARFTVFYRTSIARLVTFLCYHGADFYEAADIAQETMILAHRDWDNIESPRAWIRKTAGRALARRRAAVREVPSDPITATSLISATTDEIAAWHHEHHLLGALAQLSMRQRQVMAWHLDGYGDDEVAEILEISPANVRSHRSQARKQLTLLLLADEGDS